MTSLLNILKNLLEKETINDIASKLNVASGTVKRWVELENVPTAYTFELMRIADMPIDYSRYSFKEKDQFYTSSTAAKYCYEKAVEVIKLYGDDPEKYLYVEPSAGSGNFLEHLPLDRRVGIDIEPNNNEIILGDYLSYSPPSEEKNIVVIGNPPFGLRGQLALKFINHSSDFADYVCFILPQLFESDGKGVPRKRIKDFNLVHSEKLNTDFSDPSGKKIKVECIFQVWSKNHVNSKYIINKIDTSVIKIYSLSDGGTPSTTRNKNMFYKCDIYLPSTCFGKQNMRYYDTFNELPRKKGYGVVFNKNKKENIKKFKELDWCKIGFLSTNSAYNIRTSQIAQQFN
tara:strand:- start:210 stop:1241 length:1032 start_codon:yes stop_codon:yes gene_type:complete